MKKAHSHGNKRRLAVVVALGILLVTLIAGWAYFHRLTVDQLSEDAVIGAETVHIAAAVGGRVVELKVVENGKVAKGDLLFAIDPDFYRLRVQQTQAELKMAEAALETRTRAIQAEQSNATIATEQINRARTNLVLATQTWQRLNSLLPKGYVTAQQVDEAATLKRNAQTSLNEALAQETAAQALVGTIDGAQALVADRQVAVAIAQRELAQTQVRAPNSGRVVGLAVAEGDFLLPAQSVFTLINTDTWYASATYLETRLSDIAVGDCATVFVASARNVAINGVVEGIGWGVSSEEVLNLPRRLPYVPKTLNWVRVGQRFPVRIRLESPPENSMRVGASAIAIVKHGKKC